MQDFPPGTLSPHQGVIDSSFQKYGRDLRKISLKIHKYQELAFEEHRSAKLLSEFLKSQGFTIKRDIAGLSTAFVASYSQNEGPSVSFNAVL